MLSLTLKLLGLSSFAARYEGNDAGTPVYTRFYLLNITNLAAVHRGAKPALVRLLECLCYASCPHTSLNQVSAPLLFTRLAELLSAGGAGALYLHQASSEAGRAVLTRQRLCGL